MAKYSQSEGKQTFVYPNLSDSSDVFRLLELWPGDFPDPVECRLFSCSIAEARGRYKALSYTWGPPASSRWIFLDDCKFPVRENLHGFLESYRGLGSTGPIILWIDAICIDQQNVAERNQQVQAMGRIFKGAATVCTWLGPATEDSDYLFEYISSCRPNPETLERNSPEPERPGIRDAVIRVLKRPYWTRLWVVQEIMLAREITVMCGTKSLDWDDFQGFVAQVPDMRDGFESLHTDVQRLQDGRERLENQELSLQDAISTFGDRDGQEMHDRVYAFLGIAGDFQNRTSKGFSVDYANPIEQLFVEVLTFCGPRIDPGFIPKLANLLGVKADESRCPTVPTRERLFLNDPVTLQMTPNGTLGDRMPHTRAEPWLEGITMSALPLLFYAELPRSESWSESLLPKRQNLMLSEGICFFFDNELSRYDHIYNYFRVSNDGKWESITQSRTIFVCMAMSKSSYRHDRSILPILGLFVPNTEKPQLADVKHSLRYCRKLKSQLETGNVAVDAVSGTLRITFSARTWLSWFGTETWIGH